MGQETGVAGPVGVLCPGGIELTGSEDCLFTWEAGSDDHSDVVSTGIGTGSSGFLGRASRSFPKRSFWVFMVSSIVAWGNLRGGMVDCCRWLLLLFQTMDEKLVWRNVNKTLARLCKKMKKGLKKKSFWLVPGSPLTRTR